MSVSLTIPFYLGFFLISTAEGIQYIFNFKNLWKGVKMKTVSALIWGCLLLAGCSDVNSVQPVQKSNLTPGMVKKQIIKGVTTQNEILQVFGAPNIVTKNKTGNEVWTYDTISVEKSAEAGYWTVVVAGASGGKHSSSVRTFTLMIEFDSNDVVKDCSYRVSSF
jgi:outer membrane protein assembly factor BamE (lipoprotein component of BamABCDE complex)